MNQSVLEKKKKHTRTNSNKNHAIILKWNYFLALTTIHQIIYRSSYGKYSRRNAFKLNIHSKLSSPTWRDGIHIFIHAYIIYTSIILYSVFTFIYKNKVLPAYPTYTKYTSICLTCIRTSIYIYIQAHLIQVTFHHHNCTIRNVKIIFFTRDTKT